MNKIKLLTSISALFLVLSVGACSVEDDDSIDDTIIEDDGEESTSESNTNENITSETTSENDTSETTDDDSSEYIDPYEGFLNDPKEVITDIFQNNNYHLQLKHEILTTKDEYRMSYDEYWNDYQDADAVLSGNIKSDSITLYDIYYTKDYVWMSQFEYTDLTQEEDEEEAWDYVSTGYQQVYYNEGNNKCYIYTTYDDGETWSASSKNYKWQDFVNSLAYAYELQVQNYFTYAGVGLDTDGNYFDWYNMSATVREQYLFECIGTDFIYSVPKDMVSYYTYYLTGFYYETQRMDMKYYWGDVFFEDTEDEEVTDDTLVYYKEEELTATAYDFDKADDNGYSESIHNMMQNG